MTKRNITGLMLLNKPCNMTSNAALQKVKRLFNAKKAGHTGSLDPLATGLLPICFGDATKFSQFLLNADKYYQVIAKLGVATETGDAEGQSIETLPVDQNALAAIDKVIADFHGVIQQIPPMYSALKFQGKPLYEYARQGITIEREPREITIHELTLLSVDSDSMTLQVHCSKGTYIRTLVEDIAKALGTCAHVTALHRYRVGEFHAQDMHDFDSLEDLAENNQLSTVIMPVEQVIAHLPALSLSAAAAIRVKHGNTIDSVPDCTPGLVRLYTPHEQFMGVGEITTHGQLTPKRLLVSA